MEILSALLLLGLITAAILLARFLSSPQVSDGLPYMARPSVFNRSEAAFFLELQRQLPQGYYIFPKMRIIDFIEPTNHNYAWRNKIWAKHVDYLICDATFRPALIVELNGGSHKRENRVHRDQFVQRLCAETNLKIELIAVGSDFNREAERVLRTLTTREMR